MGKSMALPPLYRHTICAAISKKFDSAVDTQPARPRPRRVGGKLKKEGLYIFGGADSNHAASGRLLHIDPSISPWRTSLLEPTGKGPEARYDHCCHFVESRSSLVVYGGRRDPAPKVCLSDAHVLDLATLAWVKVNLVSKYSAVARYGFLSFVDGTR
jgi:hypothetical protein